MPVEIRGYYYDETKRKYFKIEGTHTAPASAAWSADAVKKRKADDAAREAARQRTHLIRRHIKRHALRRDVVAHGLLSRQTKAEPDWARIDDGDLGAAAWAAAAVCKGSVPFVPSFARPRFANMPCFYVGGDDDKTGLGVAYATLDEETLVGSYIPMDDNHRSGLSRAPDVATGF